MGKEKVDKSVVRSEADVEAVESTEDLIVSESVGRL